MIQFSRISRFVGRYKFFEILQRAATQRVNYYDTIFRTRVSRITSTNYPFTTSAFVTIGKKKLRYKFFWHFNVPIFRIKSSCESFALTNMKKKIIKSRFTANINFEIFQQTAISISSFSQKQPLRKEEVRLVNAEQSLAGRHATLKADFVTASSGVNSASSGRVNAIRFTSAAFSAISHDPLMRTVCNTARIER